LPESSASFAQRAEGQQLAVRGSIDTGPWSGLVTLNDVIRI
jgi:hypothetical protein